MKDAVKESQTDIAPRQAHRDLVLNTQQGQSKHYGIELSRLLEQVIEVISRPLHLRRQFFCFLPLNSGGIERDVVLRKRWNSACIQEAFHCECPSAEADQRTQERQIVNRGRHDAYRKVVL